MCAPLCRPFQEDVAFKPIWKVAAVTLAAAESGMARGCATTFEVFGRNSEEPRLTGELHFADAKYPISVSNCQGLIIPL